eukprot:CAMPEP_0179092220 /NCGR_PEP_ID=MMETSP0796-20121207/42167_1 /TAXON_ID=73915 /ORGANISM="Pyrodinium bahamense, Strain pbaha01" /LENGTH=87 /DNA_ID=CAMNT_0020789823 /DNA_START=58 /DNA_END=318 /DNA_ORIENTATION=-
MGALAYLLLQDVLLMELLPLRLLAIGRPTSRRKGALAELALRDALLGPPGGRRPPLLVVGHSHGDCLDVPAWRLVARGSRRGHAPHG